MKNKIIYGALLAIFSLTNFSCKKYLDATPNDVVVPNKYYSTAAEINAALAGIYSSLAQDGTYGRNIPLELEMGNDEGQYNNRNNNVNNPSLYDCQASTTIYSDCWSALYKGINASNYLLSSINNSSLPDSLKNRATGEATFIRAFNYFQLVSRYGAVPLILKPTTEVGNVNYPRTRMLDVYKQILADMKIAEGLVNDYNTNGSPARVSKTAVQGIIARVYLKMAGRPLNLGNIMYDSARQWAMRVVNSGVHSLNKDYNQVFTLQSKDAYDNIYKESMWEVEFYGNNTPVGTMPPGSKFACFLAMRYTGLDPNPLVVYGYGSYIPTGNLYDMYQRLATSDTLTNGVDVRRNWNIPNYTYTANTVPRTAAAAPASTWDRDCGKWKRDDEVVIPKNRDWGPTNFPIIRYADVLLMVAEAQMELGNIAEATTYLNLVRARANASIVTPAIATSQATLRNIIRDERARELCFEATRKFDLVRWGTIFQSMQDCKNLINNSTSSATLKNRYLTAYNNFKLRDTLLPIPSSELSVNGLMTQNAGW
jgi:hypothetical protein